jgi:hypothetical protein
VNNGPFELLRTLRDIKGVQGSFVVRAGNGELLGRDLPAVIDDAILVGIGPRIDRLLSIMDSEPPTDAISMRFGEQRLDIKRLGTVHLCVLAEADISTPALRMAIKLIGRKLAEHDWNARRVAPSAPSAPAPVHGGSSWRTILFRGRRITTS